MNIFYDEKLAKEMEEEARLQAIFDRALTDPESLNEVSDEDLEKLMPYMDRLILKLEEEFEILKEQSQKLLAELDEYIKMAEAEEMKMLAEMKKMEQISVMVLGALSQVDAARVYSLP